MLPVNGKPCMEYLIEHLNSFGITEIMTNLHYRPQDVISHFGGRLIYLYEKRLLGEEGTLRAASPWFDNYTIVMNGDTLTNINISEMVRMARGNAVKYMDGEIYAGTRIIRSYYSLGKEFLYQDPRAKWLDIGTFPGLLKAKEFVKEIYAKPTGN